MLKEKSIKQLLSGKLAESELKERLLQLTPEKLDAEAIKRCVDELRDFCTPDFKKLSGLGAQTLDCSGTGGSGRARFNTSTAAAFVISAAGINVAKFGNRAATSKSGSFDVLEKIGIKEHMTAANAARVLNAAGLVFIFAPQAYPALGALSAVRAAVGIPTIFNFVGPLLNPVSPAFRVMGVADPIMQALVATFVKETGKATASMIVRSMCGLDEICPCCGATVKEVRKQEVKESVIKPVMPDHNCRSTKDHSPEENAEILIRIVRGEDADSYEYELVCQNAGAGIFIAGKAKSVDEGIELARELLASGAVAKQLEKVRDAYGRYSS